MTTPIDPRDPDDPKRVEAFDTYARQAGSSLREAAPPNGAMWVMRTARRRVAIRTAGAVGVAGILAIGGVSLVNSNDDDNSTPVANSAATTPSTAPSTTDANTATSAVTTIAAAAPSTDAAAADEATAWALEYVGGTPGAASGEPVRIGVAYDTASPYLPQVEAMGDFVNQELGGIGGRPVEFVACNVGQVAFGIVGADEEACAAQLGEDPNVIAVLTLWHYGAFEETLGSAKPLLVGWPATGTSGVSYHAGPLELIGGLGALGSSLLPSGAPQQIALVAQVNEALLLEGRLGAVDVLDVASGPGDDTVEELVAAIQAAGAEDAPVVAGYSDCDVVEAAYLSLGRSPIFIGPYWCAQEGWYVVGETVDPNEPDLASGELTVVAKLEQYGQAMPSYARSNVDGAHAAGDLLTLVRVLNEIGTAEATPEQVTAGLKAYRGPVLFGAGNADCALSPPTTLRPNGGCTVLLEVSRIIDGVPQPLPPIDLNV